MGLDHAQEPAMAHIREVATITSKGQITLPKPIRQALGVDSGGQVAFDFNGKSAAYWNNWSASRRPPTGRSQAIPVPRWTTPTSSSTARSPI